jgi:peptidoglycan/LPS O-acetylase OafA/YrhL
MTSSTLIDTASTVTREVRPEVSRAGGRLLALDGLRAYAVLGVIWVHLAGFFYAGLEPKIVFQVLSFLGIGVDLFFVISGFCMFHMYVGRQSEFSLQQFWKFIKGRIARIVPMYWLVVLATSLNFWLLFDFFPWKETIVNAFFLNTLPIDLQAPWLIFHFWSLSTEWQFYLLLPPFVWLCTRIGVMRALGFGVLISIGLSLVTALIAPQLHETLKPQVLLRFVQFGAGIFAAHCYQARTSLADQAARQTSLADQATRQTSLPFWLIGNRAVLAGFAIAFVGRCMAYRGLPVADSLKTILGALSYAVIGLGFGLVVRSVVQDPSALSRMFAHAWLGYLGKISYSMYLWHWLICSTVAPPMLAITGLNVRGLLATFVLVCLLTIAISHVSYHWVEARYFKKRG